MKKITFNAPVILTFTLLSAGALIANTLTNGWANAWIFSIYRTSFRDPMQYVRLFTHVLGHASIDHYASNMIMFLLVGPLLEEKYGSRRILQVILVVALVTGLVHLALPDNTALLGASGIDFAFILMASVTGNNRGGIPLTMIIVAVIYLGRQIYAGITASDNISQLTHIIGGSIGALYGLALQKR
ncbi:MAG: rhomboid family intramembrane serine protease [Erysipelotrichaceae bacterium]|jgi:GlpG protein|nr:rhomboid family intramembrane serine protease [Lactimicrobium massiliense]MCH4020262.1 rhomboid family intramembrane serine protease [Erysipelotrichaceae bacterium]MCI1327285.1 rhomboid family intramembrane serine protease [Solobacterium sp.]MCH4044743.1 rhomboid family intramembrane serine protease [Erysipelotrichaceae bacterium]MCH4121955.1 rhomboid family intramembrane serine protease [Erysipelotrichaceae bacterium]MCI1364036.1 rhomboid family intramembrane serine protease [Solobacterium